MDPLETGMFPHLEFKEEESQKFGTFGDISKSEENACTQEPLVITPEEELSSLSSCSPDLPNVDSLPEYESSVPASEISQDEVRDLMEKNDANYTFCMEGQLFLEENNNFHPVLEDLPYDEDFEDCSQKDKFSLSKRGTGQIRNKSGFEYSWKESYNKERLLFQSGFEKQLSIGDSPPENKIVDLAKEDCLTNQDVAEGATLETSHLKSVSQTAGDDQILHYDAGILTIMQEPLLDCIVKESPNKEVSVFLSKSDGSFVSGSSEKKKSFPDIVKPFINKDGIHIPDCPNKVLEHEIGNGHHLKTAESSGQMENMSLKDSMDKHITFIKCFMHSSRNVNENARKNVFHRNTKAESNDECLQAKTIDLPEAPETNVNPLLAQQESMVATLQHEKKSEDLGNKGIVPPHSNSFLSFQVAKLQDDIEKMKAANHSPSTYETILNMYKNKNAQLGTEKLQMQQMMMNLNEVIKRLEQDQKRQQTQILNLEYDNLSLMTKNEELQLELAEQITCAETLKDLEKTISDLTDSRSHIVEEKQATERSLKSMQEAFANAQQQLQESVTSGKTLGKQLEKLRVDHSLLQEKHKAEVEEKNKSMNQCLEMDYTICKKEEEIEEFRQANGKLQSEVKAAISNLQRLTREKESTEKHLLSFQAELQQEAKIRAAEKEHFESKYAWLVSEVKILQANFEKEQSEAENQKQHMGVVMKENLELRQQAVINKDLNHQMLVEIDSWKQQFNNAVESHTEKEQIHNQTIQSLRYEMAALKEALKTKEEEIQRKMHMLGRFLLDMRSVHYDLTMKRPPCEADCFNSMCVQRATHVLSKINNLLALTERILICQDTDSYSSKDHSSGSSKNERINELKEKIKGMNNKKDALEKELQERGLHLSTVRELSNEKASRESITQINKLEDFLDLKSEECTKLTGENGKLQRDLNSLVCKVASFEEIIQCADQRLEMYSSQISQLEKRNQYLEGRIQKFREERRKHRQRNMAKQFEATSLLQNKELQETNVGNLKALSQDAK